MQDSGDKHYYERPSFGKVNIRPHRFTKAFFCILYDFLVAIYENGIEHFRTLNDCETA